VNHPDVAVYFRDFVRDILPTEAALARVDTHAEQVAKRLRTSFAVNRVLTFGSHWKGTAIQKHSDLDLFVVMSSDETRKWSRDDGSRTILARVRNDLQERFRATTVRRDGQAVVVKFDQGDFAVDVVPAKFAGLGSAATYLIPDGMGQWIETSPSAQKASVDAANEASGGKVVPVIRLLKWWAQARGATSVARSLYFEVLTPLCGIGVGTSYAEAVAGIFAALATHRCPPLQPPPDVFTGPIGIAATEEQRRKILEVVIVSHERAVKAREAEGRGNSKEAIRLWNVIFNHT
jgi:predicted nucleotidyltransferase